MNRYCLRRLLLALISSLALAGGGAASAAVPEETTAETQVQLLREAIRKHRIAARHWQRVMGKPRTRPGVDSGRSDPGHLERLTALRDYWRRRATRLRALGWHPPNPPAWRCIHRREGGWNDPRAPYWGGLQMSMQFQRSFGRYLLRVKGTADRWTPAEQMWTAERARRSGLGFHPWPNTAGPCGLL